MLSVEGVVCGLPPFFCSSCKRMSYGLLAQSLRTLEHANIFFYKVRGIGSRAQNLRT